MDDQPNPKPTGKAAQELLEKKVKNKRWEVISKEFSSNEYGKLTLSKVVFQLKREFTLKVISAFAVIVAFIGLIFNLYFQRKQNEFQISEQRALFQFGIYTKCMSNLIIISDGRDIDSSFIKAKNSFEDENMPQVALLGDSILMRKFFNLNNLVALYQYAHVLLDTVKTLTDFERTWTKGVFPDTVVLNENFILSKKLFMENSARLPEGSKYEKLLRSIPKPNPYKTADDFNEIFEHFDALCTNYILTDRKLKEKKMNWHKFVNLTKSQTEDVVDNDYYQNAKNINDDRDNLRRLFIGLQPMIVNERKDILNRMIENNAVLKSQ